ncbi:MAG: hypothetical protein JO006_18455, partial [Paucibacter sp.]|nr:hypothetical protein [Roseateles sp.]
MAILLPRFGLPPLDAAPSMRLRAAAEQARLELELLGVAPPALDAEVAPMLTEGSPLLAAMQTTMPPPWVRAGVDMPPPQAWAEQSLAALRLGQPLPAPHADGVWV